MVKREPLQYSDEVTKSIDLYCPYLKCGGTVNILKCLYRCPKARILKCSAYTAIYPQLINFSIDDKYLAKYGEVTIPIPLSLRKRRKRRGINSEDDLSVSGS